MRMKKGISLIVLSITILVMVILASTVLITLENSDIIKRANKTVSNTDIKNIQILATTLWTSASMDGLEGDDLTAAVIEGLINSNIDVNKVDIKVTEDGVKVSELKSGVKFGKLYQAFLGDFLGEMVFYEDGSATSWVTYFTGEMAGITQAEYLPAGSIVYTDTTLKIVESGETVNISLDGNKLSTEEIELTIANVIPGKIQKGVPYTATMITTSSYIVFEEDGSISSYQDGELMERIPASELTYADNYIEYSGEYMPIYPNGKKLGIPGVCAFEIGEGVKFGKKYSVTDDGETQSIVFYEDGSVHMFVNGVFYVSAEAGTFTHMGNVIAGPDIIVIVSLDRNTIYFNGVRLDIEK